MKNYVTEFESKNLFSNRKEERSTIVIPKNELFVRGREKEKMVNENVLTNPTIVKFSRNRILRKRDFLFQKTPRSFSYTLKRQTLTCSDSHPLVKIVFLDLVVTRSCLETILPNFLEYLPLFVNEKNLKCTFLYLYRESWYSYDLVKRCFRGKRSETGI